MKLFVGLGNPGARHQHQRHNVGFMAVDRIALRHRFEPWRARFQSLVSAGELSGHKVLLIKPQTFMNESGRAVGEALRFFKLEPQAVTAFHDELDLAAGKLRAKTGGGTAGHNGLRSLGGHIGPAFGRVRIGIGHPGAKELVLHHVLSDFSKSEADWLEPLLDAIADAAPFLATGDEGRFMNRVAVLIQGAGGASAPPEKG